MRLETSTIFVKRTLTGTLPQNSEEGIDKNQQVGILPMRATLHEFRNSSVANPTLGNNADVI